MAQAAPIYQPGDLLFFSGRGFISRMVKGFTVSPWYWFIPNWRCVSHVGICCDWRGPVYLVESTTLSDEPCEITGRMHNGMQAHKPGPRVKGDSGYVWQLRPNIDRMSWTCGHNKALRLWLARQMAKGYDSAGAFQSAIRPSNADLSRVFCSEVVAGALMEVGRLPLDNPGVYTPAKLIRELVRIGTYSPAVRLK